MSIPSFALMAPFCDMASFSSSSNAYKMPDGSVTLFLTTMVLSNALPTIDIIAPGTPCPVQSTAATTIQESLSYIQWKSPLTMSFGLNSTNASANASLYTSVSGSIVFCSL